MASGNNTEIVPDESFATIYNDIETYPNLIEVALQLGISYQTVRNRASILKGRFKRGEKVPELISRVPIAKQKDVEEGPSARDHANNRANELREAIQGLVTESRYPVRNPEALIVESFVQSVYDRNRGVNVEKEGTPRTWVSDTLRVDGVEDPRGRRFIFTGAQNDAEVHTEFFRNLKAYANHIDADVVIGPWTYETQWWSENNPTSRTYDEALREYLCFGQMKVGDNFVFCGEMNTLPTAARPIGDLKTYTCGKWGVFPHAKIQLFSVASTDPAQQAHQVMTTGAVTRPKVIPRKAGVKSIFHHVIGAVVVEFDDEGDLFCRHINASDDGSFYDLDRFVTGGKVKKSAGVEAIVVGDLHLRKLDPTNAKAVFGFDQYGNGHKGSMLEALKPDEILLHDIFDNEARNHHHIDDNGYAYEMAYSGRESVLGEIYEVTEFLKRLNNKPYKVTVIESNHDLGLTRYINEGRYRNDGLNIRIGLELEIAYVDYRAEVVKARDNHEIPPSFSLLEHAVRKFGDKTVENVGWVHDGQSHIIGSIECGNHGFRGPNGAKGSVTGFASTGIKMSIADKHSPEILDGVYVAGCMNLQHGYNKGPSRWAVAHIVHYTNGKRAIITCQKGKWRA